MKEISFLEVELQNFKNHQNRTFTFKDGSLILLTGNNGAGKTSIFSALVWALYGRTLEGQTGSDIVRKRAGKNCFVKVTWTDGENTYRVEAYREHEKYGNNRLLFRNDENITQPTAVATIELIEKLIMPRNVFVNCLVFSGSNEHLLDLTPQERFSIISRMLGLENFDIYRENANDWKKYYEVKTAVLENNKRLAMDRLTYLETEIGSIENEIKAISSELVSYTTIKALEKNQLLSQISELNVLLKDFSEIESEYNAKRTALLTARGEMELLEREKRQEIQACVGMIQQELQNEVSRVQLKYQDELTNIVINISEIEQQIGSVRLKLEKELYAKSKEFDTKLNGLAQKIREEELKKKSQKLLFEQKESALKESLNSLDKQKRDLLNRINTIKADLNKPTPICPLCKRPLTSTAELDLEIARLEQELRRVEESYNSVLQEKSEIPLELDKAIREIDTFIASLNTEYQRLQVEKDRSEFIIRSTLEKELDTLNEKKGNLMLKQNEIKNKMTEEISAIKAEFEIKKQEQIKEISNKWSLQVSKLLEQITQLESEYKAASILYEERCKQKQELIKLQEQVKKIDELVEQYKQTCNENVQAKRKKIESTKLMMLSLRKNIGDLESELEKYRRTIEILNFWKTGFSDSGIKSMLVDEAIPLLNQEARQLCSTLGTIKISFDTQSFTKTGVRNKFAINALQMENLSSAKELSSGEKRLADLIVLLSLRRLLEVSNNCKFNILLLDEMLDSLDSENCINVVSLLSKLSEDGRCVVLITHTMRELGMDIPSLIRYEL